LFENSSLHHQANELSGHVFEFTEFLTDILEITSFDAVWNGKVTYHDSCSALRECRIKEAPRKLLQAVKGLELIEMKDNETCCGFGGSFSVKFAPISTAMADLKVKHAMETGANAIVSTDMSCLMQIDGYIKAHQFPISTFHIADILAAGW
jgi:L-lactate dehydrogenase complex protein LldE